VARPIPALPPVTRATRWLNNPDIALLSTHVSFSHDIKSAPHHALYATKVKASQTRT
jgi:hypothetical protein